MNYIFKKISAIVTSIALFGMGTTVTENFASEYSYSITANATENKVFSDIDSNAWYADAVQFVYNQGIMNGFPDHSFGPNNNISKGQFVTVLYNLDKKPIVHGTNIFLDVKPTDYYAVPAIWANYNSIAFENNGYFSPNYSIPREYMVTMLYNYAKRYKKYTIVINKDALNKFGDAQGMHDWAKEPMMWAITNGIIQGKGKDKNGKNILDPLGKATRAECAQMLYNFSKKY